ncbi:MAG: hemerythrin domain-containing protein [Candidatus Eremiobacteraeota bacterium]|nr:hemerythrin domain-containing protein [Candidatus Eremiobacteraeota bacterium]
MDAIKLLKKDHRDVDAMFKEAHGLSDGASVSRRKLFDQIADALELHTQVEEKIFYPAVKDASLRDKEAREEVFEAYEEHDNVKAMIEKLRETDAKDETYKAKLQVLEELVKHHVKEEERSFFPQAQELLGADEIEQLGEQIAQAKARAMNGATNGRRRQTARR